MTREEAIDKIIRIRQQQGESEAHEALGMAIDALAYQAELPDGLEEAAEEYTRSEYSSPCAFGGENIEEWVSRIFIAGAEWDRAKMMEKAVEGVARPDDCEIWVNLVGYGYKFKDGDKVKVIVISE